METASFEQMISDSFTRQEKITITTTTAGGSYTDVVQDWRMVSGEMVVVFPFMEVPLSDITKIEPFKY